MKRFFSLAGVRLVALSLFVALAALVLSHFGWVSRLETVLIDHVLFADPIAPSGRTVVVKVDEKVVEETGKYPVDRAVLADALAWLKSTGAARVHIDLMLNAIESPDADARLEASLAAFGRERISLPAVSVPTPDGGQMWMRPHERFARHATLTLASPVFDADRRARRMEGDRAGLGPATGNWLSLGPGAVQTGPRPIDFSIDGRAIPQVSLLDVARGKAPADLFRNAHVVLGLTISTPLTIVNVPVYERLSRTETIALAAETLLVGKRYRVLSMAEKGVLTLMFALVVCGLLQRLGSFASLVLVVGGCTAWFYWVGALQRISGVQLPMTTLPFAAVLAWQIVKLRDSRFSHALQRFYTRLFGVGQNALVMAVEVIGDPAFVVTAQGQVVGANEPFTHLVQAAFPGTKSATHVPVEVIFPGQLEPVLQGHAGPQISHIELTMTGPDQTLRIFDASLRSLRTVTGQVTIASLKDVTEVRNREAELTNLAFRDALTGLSNRVAFHARLHALGSDPSRHFAVHLIDLDGFKKVNDTLGHHAGDVLLAGVGKRLQKLVRPEDMVARLGGDEFAILQSGVDEAGAATLAARIIAALCQPFDLDGAPARIGASIGIALWPDHHAEAGEALKLADAAMYVAKRNKPAYAIHAPGGALLVA